MASVGLEDANNFVVQNEFVPPQFKACTDGAECTHLQAFKNYRFSEEGLIHLTTFDHGFVPCVYGRECRSHCRLCEGAWRFDDRCHVAVYSHGWPGPHDQDGAAVLHGEDRAWLGKQFACTGGGLYILRGEWKKEANLLESCGVALVQRELDAHGLGLEMKLLDTVVPQKRRHPRLKDAHGARPQVCAYGQDGAHPCVILKGREVLDVELFAGLLYTGTDAQGQIREALRMPADCLSAAGWKWTITALKHLVVKLAERPPSVLFHGLNNVIPPREDTLYTEGNKKWASYNNLVSGSMSLSIARTFARSRGGTVADASSVGLVLHMQMSSSIVVADMRWISKFPDEQEWLLVPCVNTQSGLWIEKYRSEPLSSGGELTHILCTFS